MSDILSEIYQPIVAHNISKGREIMKKNYGVVISLLFLFLFGCSSQDNKSNNHSTDDARLEPVEQAYDGCNKLLGSDHGSFKLPEKISKVDFNKVYSLSCNTLKNDDMTNAEKLFKTFYGDDFDESALSTDNGGIVYQAGINTSAYLGMDIALYSADYEFQENSSGQAYVVGLDEGGITLGGKAIDVTDIDSGLNNYLADFYKDFTINTKEFSVNDTVGRIDFTASLDYENVPFQYSPSAYSRADNENNMSYWTFLQVTGSIGADGKFDFINANAPLNILDKTEKTEMIPFDEAVKILETELAKGSYYEFSNVELMYCCLANQPALDMTEEDNVAKAEQLAEEYNKTPKNFEPMWCFEIKGGEGAKEYIKVNALSGEVFIDVQ